MSSQLVLTPQDTQDIPPVGKLSFYFKEDGKMYKKDENGTETLMTPTIGNVHHVFFKVQAANDYGNYKTLSIGQSSSFRVSFYVPVDFNTLLYAQLICIPSAGAAGTSRNIDVYSSYAGTNELSTTHSESDTTTTYNLSGKSDRITAIDVSSVFSNLAPEDAGGLYVVHNSVGGNIDYLGLELEYT